MIKHCVMMELDEAGINLIDNIAEKILSLKNSITSIKEIEVGRDILHSDRSYDLMLTVTFNSLDHMLKYQEDENHLKVLEIIKPHLINSITVDYNI